MGPFLSLAALRRSLAKSSSRSKKQGVTHSVGSVDSVDSVGSVGSVDSVGSVQHTVCDTPTHHRRIAKLTTKLPFDSLQSS